MHLHTINEHKLSAGVIAVRMYAVVGTRSVCVRCRVMQQDNIQSPM